MTITARTVTSVFLNNEGRDDGCNYNRYHPAFNKCLACPLTIGCRYDVLTTEPRRLAKAAGVWRLALAGCSDREIAARFGIRPGLIRRILRQVALARLAADLPAVPDGATALLLRIDSLSQYRRGDDDPIVALMTDADYLTAL